MTILYDKKGNAFKVTHSVDVKEWVDAGYSEEKPKRKAPLKKEEVKKEEPQR